MAFRVMVHPEVQKALEGLPKDRRRKVREALGRLSENPFTSRPETDIKEIKGQAGRRDVFRLRVGDYRVLYDVEGSTVWVTELFRRERGYRRNR